VAIPTDRPIAIYYEHPDWFRPLFAELERRGIPHVRLHADEHGFNPAEPVPYSLAFNRMSPSAYLRGRGDAIFYSLAYLAHLQRRGVRVVNGCEAFRMELSKAAQLSLLHSLGLPCPESRVIHRPAQAVPASADLRFPVVVKPNIGGSGAGVQKFETSATLQRAVEAGTLELGIDSTALVQEFIPQEASRIVRVEVLDGRCLYGIRIYTPGNSFDLCPADVCQRVDGAALDAQICAADAPARGLRVEAYEPPPEVQRQVESIMAAAGIEVGGVEYMIDERDGRLHFYDINALSNFVADAPNVVGFDPVARLVDYLVREAAAVSAASKEAA
jgi:biotin carboxylase